MSANCKEYFTSLLQKSHMFIMILNQYFREKILSQLDINSNSILHFILLTYKTYTNRNVIQYTICCVHLVHRRMQKKNGWKYFSYESIFTYKLHLNRT